MKSTVYIETTIPSYFCDTRDCLAADIQRTCEWWDHERADYECFISPVVQDELAEGAYPNRDRCLALVAELPMLAFDPAVLDIAQVYQQRRLMPRFPVRDALHQAFASYYRMDYMLTWNCRHLANANKIRHLEAVNTSLGLMIPLLVTPDMLRPLEEDL